MEPAGSKEPPSAADLPPSGLLTAAYSARQSPPSGFQVVTPIAVVVTLASLWRKLRPQACRVGVQGWLRSGQESRTLAARRAKSARAIYSLTTHDSVIR